MSVARIRALIATAGQTVILRRITGTTTPVWYDVACKASVRGYQPAELIGPVQQGDREVIVATEAMVAFGWPLPPRKGDKVVIDGVVTNVEAVEGRHFREDIAFFVLRCRS
jgi:hypothetical protein